MADVTDRKHNADPEAWLLSLAERCPPDDEVGETEATTVARPSAPALAAKYPGLFKSAPVRPGRIEVVMLAPKKPARK